MSETENRKTIESFWGNMTEYKLPPWDSKNEEARVTKEKIYSKNREGRRASEVMREVTRQMKCQRNRKSMWRKVRNHLKYQPQIPGEEDNS
jgi:hypothetical protein